ncbi:MAG TPA: sialidase family protein [Nevskiaceae bacterium]|nr:sialidase family protein [Nevskiaceae bacterium]
MRLGIPLALIISVPAAAAHGANPADGTLSVDNPTITYNAGPFAVPNASLSQDAEHPQCLEPIEPCDDFALTVDVPVGYAATHPFALITMAAKWAINNDAFNLYVLDADGNVIALSISANDPNSVSWPAVAGNYTVRMVPSNVAGDLVTASIMLVPDPVSPATGTDPGFLALAPPAGLGDNTNGEMNVGFNSKSGRVLTLGFTQTLRTTFADNVQTQDDATWEDVSEPNTQLNSNDPILAADRETGRMFISQLQGGTPGESIFYYTDDDGDSWTFSPLTLSGGPDHQTVGSGPYSATGSAGPTGDYPHAVYYCSQAVAAAFCIRSDDGGATFGLPVPIKNDVDCDGFLGAIHGHVKIAPDGTVYVPDRNCGGQQALIVSEDSGDSFTEKRLPATATAGEGDPSIAIASDGTGYFCYLAADSHVHVAVTHDKGDTWINDRDIGYAAGVVHAVFPEAVAGDPDRAACAFLGTNDPGPYQSTSFQGIWFPYIAMTYDGGNTWHTVNATPADPVQGTGGICLAGTTCIENRNLLDFNEITLDNQGRVLFAFDDGCTDDCILPPYTPNQVCLGSVCLNGTAKTTILRQASGRTLYAAFDPPDAGPSPTPTPVASSGSRFGGALGWLTLLPLFGASALKRWRRSARG